jgi:hypothetical protein
MGTPIRLNGISLTQAAFRDATLHLLYVSMIYPSSQDACKLLHGG